MAKDDRNVEGAFLKPDLSGKPWSISSAGYVKVGETKADYDVIPAVAVTPAAIGPIVGERPGGNARHPKNMKG